MLGQPAAMAPPPPHLDPMATGSDAFTGGSGVSGNSVTQAASVHAEDLYCICRKPEGGQPMCLCDGCDQWFHASCMNVSQAMLDCIEADDAPWSCSSCAATTTGPVSSPKSQERLLSFMAVDPRFLHTAFSADPLPMLTPSALPLESTPTSFTREEPVMTRSQRAAAARQNSMGGGESSGPGTPSSHRGSAARSRKRRAGGIIDDDYVDDEQLHISTNVSPAGSAVPSPTSSFTTPTSEHKRHAKPCKLCARPVASSKHDGFCSATCLDSHVTHATILHESVTQQRDRIASIFKDCLKFLKAPATTVELAAVAAVREDNGVLFSNVSLPAAELDEQRVFNDAEIAALASEIETAMFNKHSPQLVSHADVAAAAAASMRHGSRRSSGARGGAALVPRSLPTDELPGDREYKAQARELSSFLKKPKSDVLHAGLRFAFLAADTIVNMPVSEFSSEETNKLAAALRANMGQVVRESNMDRVLVKKTHKGDVEVERSVNGGVTDDRDLALTHSISLSRVDGADTPKASDGGDATAQDDGQPMVSSPSSRIAPLMVAVDSATRTSMEQVSTLPTIQDEVADFMAINSGDAHADSGSQVRVARQHQLPLEAARDAMDVMFGDGDDIDSGTRVKDASAQPSPSATARHSSITSGQQAAVAPISEGNATLAAATSAVAAVANAPESEVANGGGGEMQSLLAKLIGDVPEEADGLMPASSPILSPTLPPAPAPMMEVDVLNQDLVLWTGSLRVTKPTQPPLEVSLVQLAGRALKTGPVGKAVLAGHYIPSALYVRGFVDERKVNKYLTECTSLSSRREVVVFQVTPASMSMASDDGDQDTLDPLRAEIMEAAGKYAGCELLPGTPNTTHEPMLRKDFYLCNLAPRSAPPQWIDRLGPHQIPAVRSAPILLAVMVASKQPEGVVLPAEREAMERLEVKPVESASDPWDDQMQYEPSNPSADSMDTTTTTPPTSPPPPPASTAAPSVAPLAAPVSVSVPLPPLPPPASTLPPSSAPPMAPPPPFQFPGGMMSGQPPMFPGFPIMQAPAGFPGYLPPPPPPPPAALMPPHSVSQLPLGMSMPMPPPPGMSMNMMGMGYPPPPPPPPGFSNQPMLLTQNPAFHQIVQHLSERGKHSGIISSTVPPQQQGAAGPSAATMPSQEHIQALLAQFAQYGGAAAAPGSRYQG